MNLFFSYGNGNWQDNCIRTHNKTTASLLIFSLLYLCIGSSFQSHVFAQTSASAVNMGHAPMITKISNKGSYEVQLGWNKPVLIHSLPHVWQVHIFFMNATGHAATLKTIPNKTAKSGGTTIGVGTQYRVPGSIKRLLPASSFDMTIYGKHGKVLWNKVKEPVTGGVGLETVVLPKGYTGDITILIHNIKSPAWLQKIPTDSVEFSGKVG
jgi:hypothetical protein